MLQVFETALKGYSSIRILREDQLEQGRTKKNSEIRTRRKKLRRKYETAYKDLSTSSLYSRLLNEH